MYRAFLTWLMTNLVVVGVLVDGEQPIRASDLGQTGTQASPAGSPTPAPTPLVSQNLPITAVSNHRDKTSTPDSYSVAPVDQKTDPWPATTFPSTRSPSPVALPDGWKELATSLRAVAESIRAFPQNCEERWQVLQRASAVAFSAGRARGWLEGAAAALLAAGLLVWLYRKQTKAKSSAEGQA